MLLVWCIYPKPQTTDPPFREEPHWSAVYPKDGQSMAEAEAPYSFEKALSHEVLMPGKCIVVGMNPLLAGYSGANRQSMWRPCVHRLEKGFSDSQHLKGLAY